MSRLALLGAAAIWGGGFIAQADAMRGLGPLWFTALRYALAAIVLVPVALLERPAADGAQGRDRAGGLLLALGTAFTAASLLQQFAITRTSVTHVGFLTGLYVLFVPFLGALILQQHPHRLVLLAAVAALAGTWLIGGGLSGLNRGDALAVGCALGFALQILLLDRIVKRTRRPVGAVLAQSAICAGVTLPIAFGLEPFHLSSALTVVPALLFAGVLSGGVAFVLQAIGQKGTQPSVAAVLLMSESLFAALFAALFLRERLTPGGWLGCGLLFVSILAAQFAPAQKGSETKLAQALAADRRTPRL